LQLEAKEGLALLNGTPGHAGAAGLSFPRNGDSRRYGGRGHGPSLDALRGTPTAFDDRIARVRNFHGQPLAMAADQLAVSIATLAGISERRMEEIVNPQLSGLPAFFVAEPGLNSVFMILHVAAAALASETKAMSFPHSVDSLPLRRTKKTMCPSGWARPGGFLPCSRIFVTC
jgi:histidine ammonia-lyase